MWEENKEDTEDTPIRPKKTLSRRKGLRERMGVAEEAKQYSNDCAARVSGRRCVGAGEGRVRAQGMSRPPPSSSNFDGKVGEWSR